MLDAFSKYPHRRWNPLRREWVLVSPHRTQRPWQGQTEDARAPAALQLDPGCYMCPGNMRASGAQNPDYEGTYVFDNDYPALYGSVPDIDVDEGGAGLIRATAARGVCRVLCFSPRHDLTLATMSEEAIAAVVHAWIAQETDLAARQEIGYVQIFENRGAIMGCSNPHPHGQIWATEQIPNEPLGELESQREYSQRHARVLLLDYLEMELQSGERIVAQNDSWIALVPFWAVWPFELMLLPRSPVGSLRQLDEPGRRGLANILKRVTAGYNQVFHVPFPYSMGFHAAPCDGSPHPEWLLHAHFYPPLLRSATVRKFMVGFEMLGSPQRDITPEAAAAILREAFESLQG